MGHSKIIKKLMKIYMNCIDSQTIWLKITKLFIEIRKYITIENIIKNFKKY